jgi:hypothetical protein
MRSTRELARAERKAEREEREANQRQARSNNEELGHRLVRRRGGKVSAKRQTERAKAVAHLVVDDNAAALGAALRLVREDWKQVEITTREDGSPGREKVTYLSPDEAVERLFRDIDQAKDAASVMEVVVEALVAASYASEEELVQSHRTYKLHLRGDGVVEELIDSEAKGVLPAGLEEVAKHRQEIRAL